MTLFSLLKRSKAKAAKSKIDGESEEATSVSSPIPPYRHVPTHAAIDALSGAPASWRYDDKPQIQEEYGRRLRLNAARKWPSKASSSLEGMLDRNFNETREIGRAGPPSSRLSDYSGHSSSWGERGDSSNRMTSMGNSHKLPRTSAHTECSAMQSSNSSINVGEDRSSGPLSSTLASSVDPPGIVTPYTCARRIPEHDLSNHFIYNSSGRKIGEAPLRQTELSHALSSTPAAGATLCAGYVGIATLLTPVKTDSEVVNKGEQQDDEGNSIEMQPIIKTI